METVVDLLFQTGTLRPAECTNGARVSRAWKSTVSKHLRGRPFESIQTCVQDRGYYLDSVEAFKEAVNLGYCAYQMTLHGIIRNHCCVDVLKYCVHDLRISILPGAVVEAMRNKNPAYLRVLKEATDPAVLREAYQWIVEERVAIHQPLELLLT